VPPTFFTKLNFDSLGDQKGSNFTFALNPKDVVGVDGADGIFKRKSWKSGSVGTYRRIKIWVVTYISATTIEDERRYKFNSKAGSRSILFTKSHCALEIQRLNENRYRSWIIVGSARSTILSFGT
jgi:hypothetical protein